MKYELYAVYDIKAEAHMQLITCPNQLVALRAFQNAILDEKSGMSRNPEDYYLAQLGTYDDQTGLIQGTVRKLIINGLDVKAAHQQKEQK